MATDVVMPQMGESIAEGTIVRWIKKVGDKVDRDEPLFEISTDKVDAEIPSPAAGVVSEIRVKEGETVPVNSVVAVIGEAGSKPAAAAPQAPPAQAAKAAEPPKASPQADGAPAAARAPAAHALCYDRAGPPRRRTITTETSQRPRPRRTTALRRAMRSSPPKTRFASGRHRSCARSRKSTTSTSRRSTARGSRDA